MDEPMTALDGIEITPQQTARLGCKVALDCISALPVEEWGGWVIYILEELDARAVQGYEQVLETVKMGADSRLSFGEW